MAENLRTTKYNDGTSIQYISDGTQWSDLPSGAYCFYESSIVNQAIYGNLYNWHAVNTGKLCPKGWHIPNETEWGQLFTYAGNNPGDKLKSIGDISKSTGLWNYPNKNATNESGFTGLPGVTRFTM
jgi:uncharacterized protein (TIGR02145 family)